MLLLFFFFVHAHRLNAASTPTDIPASGLEFKPKPFVAEPKVSQTEQSKQNDNSACLNGLKNIDLSGQLPAPKDQGKLGVCTFYGLGALFDSAHTRSRGDGAVPEAISEERLVLEYFLGLSDAELTTELKKQDGLFDGNDSSRVLKFFENRSTTNQGVLTFQKLGQQESQNMTTLNQQITSSMAPEAVRTKLRERLAALDQSNSQRVELRAPQFESWTSERFRWAHDREKNELLNLKMVELYRALNTESVLSRNLDNIISHRETKWYSEAALQKELAESMAIASKDEGYTISTPQGPVHYKKYAADRRKQSAELQEQRKKWEQMNLEQVAAELGGAAKGLIKQFVKSL